MLLILLFVALLLPVSTVSYVGAEGNVENRLASAERLIKWISDDESNVVNNVKVQVVLLHYFIFCVDVIRDPCGVICAGRSTAVEI